MVKKAVWPYVITGAVGVAVVTTIVVLASGEDEPVDDGLHKTQ
jgi:predicted anti-sigma-YlaC factor YlaD